MQLNFILGYNGRGASNVCPKYLAGHIIIKYTKYPDLKAIFPCIKNGIITISQDSCLSLMNGNYTPGAPQSAFWALTNFIPTCGLSSPHSCRGLGKQQKDIQRLTQDGYHEAESQE